MSTIGSRIRDRRKELGLTVDDLAARLGKNRATVYRYEGDEIENFPISIIDPLAQALNVSPAYLMGWTNEKQDAIQADNLFRIETRQFPMLGNIACGEPIFAEEQRELYINAGTELKADFCLRAKGDSMIGARIYDGDIVFIRSQPMVENGEIAAVIIGDEATLKRVQYDQAGNELALYPENPNYKTLRYSGTELDQIRIIGKAVAFQSDIR